LPIKSRIAFTFQNPSFLILIAKHISHSSHQYQKTFGTMNTTTMTNTTAKCPDFLESPPNMTAIGYCALGSCGNNTAVMSLCCNGAAVVPYYYDSGFPHGPHNETSGYATWCNVSNEAASMAWSSCTSSYGAHGGMCVYPNAAKSGASSSQREVGGVMGLVGLVVLLHAML
jgi:hypothetical protein